MCNDDYQFSHHDIKSTVEYIHLYDDIQLINYIEKKIVLVNEESGGEKRKDYSKLNDVINMVSLTYFKANYQFEDTILHYAVFHNRVELVQYLISKGADVNKANKRKKTPYDLAVTKNNDAILKLIDKSKL